MTLLKFAGVLVVLGGMAMAQQPAPSPQGGMQQGPAAQSPSAQPAQPATPQAPGAAEPAGQQPAGQPGAQPAQPAEPSAPQTPSGAQPGMQQSPQAAGVAGQHPDFPAGPGMIEGCVAQAGTGYSIRAAEGGQELSLSVDPSAGNSNIDRDLRTSVGQMAKIYGYPASANAGGSAGMGSSQQMTPSAAGPLQGAAGVSGAGPGASHAGVPAQEPGAASAAPVAPAGQNASPGSGPASSNTFQVTRFIPLHRPCESSTSQAPAAPGQPGSRQSAAE